MSRKGLENPASIVSRLSWPILIPMTFPYEVSGLLILGGGENAILTCFSPRFTVGPRQPVLLSLPLR